MTQRRGDSDAGAKTIVFIEQQSESTTVHSGTNKSSPWEGTLSGNPPRSGVPMTATGQRAKITGEVAKHERNKQSCEELKTEKRLRRELQRQSELAQEKSMV